MKEKQEQHQPIQEQAMEPIERRRRGRPRGTTTRPPDLYSGIWVQVRIVRVTERKRTGKALSVREACMQIAKNGGIISAIGGDREVLTVESAKGKKSLQRFEFSPDGATYGPDASGAIFAIHAMTHAGTLEARYSEAAKFALDANVRLFWMNLVRQQLGIPQKKRAMRQIGRG